jgi:hypothetical protein
MVIRSSTQSSASKEWKRMEAELWSERKHIVSKICDRQLQSLSRVGDGHKPKSCGEAPNGMPRHITL